tara:strand:- start:187 stop:807 length:621 start_codon:yes stop_codon:yes gene_type:complete
MNIEIKKSKKPIKYKDALKFMEKRLADINSRKEKELVWTLEHEEIYTAGTSYSENEILDKSIKLFKTNRGGKITYHGPGQLICYFVIDLRKRNKDIRKFISLIEKSIIDALKFYNIETFADKKNIGIWYNDNSNIKKVGAIGVRVSKWIAYHGFSININTDLNKYNSIVPCGIKNKGVTTLKKIVNQDYNNLNDIIIEKFILNLKK